MRLLSTEIQMRLLIVAALAEHALACSFLVANWQIERAELDHAAERLIPRGPDDTNVLHPDGWTMMHNLLHMHGDKHLQPYADAANRTFAVFNGELYNYRVFMPSATSDGQSLLPAYRAALPVPNTSSGAQITPEAMATAAARFVASLDGEFALVVVDFASRHVVFGTDPFATKPLFFAYDQLTGRFALASYSSPLRRLGFQRKAVHEVAPNRAWVFHMPTATAATSDTVGVQLTSRQAVQWQLQQNKQHTRDWRRAFARAITKRATHSGPHVRMHITLSYGLDSGLIHCMMDKIGTRNIVYSIVGRDPLEGVRSRIEWSNQTTEAYLIHMSAKDYQKESNFLKGHIDSYYFQTALRTPKRAIPIHSDDAGRGISFIYRHARARGGRLFMVGAGPDEHMTMYRQPKMYPVTTAFPERGPLRTPPFPSTPTLEGYFPWPTFDQHSLLGALRREEYIAGAYGIESRYPFLDKEVVQEWLYLAPHLKNGRYKAPLVDMLREECSGYPFEIIKLKYAVGKNGFFNGDVSQVNQTSRRKNRARSALPSALSLSSSTQRQTSRTPFCTLSMHTTLATNYSGPRYVYPFHAENPAAIEGMFRGLALESTPLPRPVVYCSVIGSMSGLNGLLHMPKPQHVVLYDINPWAVQYAQSLVELISLSHSREDFLSRMLSRDINGMLSALGASSLQQKHEAKLLELPLNKSLAQETQASLSPAAACAHRWLSTGLMSTPTGVPSRWTTPSVCDRLQLFHRNDRFTTLRYSCAGVTLEEGTSRSSRCGHNTCSAFYGHGWLASERTFARVRDALGHGAVSFKVFDLFAATTPPHIGVYEQHAGASAASMVQGRDVVVYVSNAVKHVVEHGVSTTSKPWLATVHDWRSKLDAADTLYIAYADKKGRSRHERWPVDQSCIAANEMCEGCTEHQWAWHVIQHFISPSTRLLEVTHKVPWGFYEYKHRSNIEVVEFVNSGWQSYTNRTIVLLHILVGDGQSRAMWLAAARRALSVGAQVWALEHVRSAPSLKPRVRKRSELFSFDELRHEFDDLAQRCGGRVLTECSIPDAARAAPRNMLFGIKCPSDPASAEEAEEPWLAPCNPFADAADEGSCKKFDA